MCLLDRIRYGQRHCAENYFLELISKLIRSCEMGSKQNMILEGE